VETQEIMDRTTGERRNAMTWKELRRMKNMQEAASQQSDKMQILKSRLTERPFWIWTASQHNGAGRSKNYFTKGNCCFNHIIGLPSKNGQGMPMFLYERILYLALTQDSYLNSIVISRPHADTIKERNDREKLNQTIVFAPFKNKHVWVKKATGLGVTEFMLRFMCWLALRNDDYQNSQMVIVTGPNQELAIKVIKRMKALFEPYGITFESKETVIELNGCSIEAYPSNHIDAFRSLTNPKFIFIDEGDFFRKNEQEEVRHVAERYIAKSDPYIVMVSTPNAPLGLFDKIEKEPFESCIYKKIFLDYTYGVGKIYTQEEIDKAKKSPSFPREYELQYQGLIGNVFSTNALSKCQEMEYDPDTVIPNCKISIGIDPSFGSSKFGIVVTRFVNERIEVCIAEDHERPDFASMISRIFEIKRKYGDNYFIFVDAANPEIWQELKRQFREDYRDTYVYSKIAEYEKNNWDINSIMRITPVTFSKHHAAMLQHAKSLIEDPRNLVAIDKRFDKLLTALRTAVAEEYKLKKDETSYNDILDAFRLSLQYYRRNK
jgi:hypothetical protein